MSLITAAIRVYEWVDILKELGIDLAESAPLKVKQEAQEFFDDPSLGEATDVLISTFSACAARGWCIEDVIAAMHEKMTANEQRQWALQEDGTYQHVEGT